MKRPRLCVQTESTPETPHRQDVQLRIGGMHKVLYDAQRPEEAHPHPHGREAFPVGVSREMHLMDAFCPMNCLFFFIIIIFCL